MSCNINKPICKYSANGNLYCKKEKKHKKSKNIENFDYNSDRVASLAQYNAEVAADAPHVSAGKIIKLSFDELGTTGNMNASQAFISSFGTNYKLRVGSTLSGWTDSINKIHAVQPENEKWYPMIYDTQVLTSPDINMNTKDMQYEVLYKFGDAVYAGDTEVSNANSSVVIDVIDKDNKVLATDIAESPFAAAKSERSGYNVTLKWSNFTTKAFTYNGNGNGSIKLRIAGKYKSANTPPLKFQGTVADLKIKLLGPIPTTPPTGAPIATAPGTIPGAATLSPPEPTTTPTPTSTQSSSVPFATLSPRETATLLNSTSAPSTTPTTTPTSTDYTSWFVVGFILLILVVGGYFYIRKRNNTRISRQALLHNPSPPTVANEPGKLNAPEPGDNEE